VKGEMADTAGTTPAADPNLGRSAVIGYVTGFLVTATAITLIGTFAGAGFTNSLGLGAFVGVWGGGGFGFMLGGTIPLARHLDTQSRSTHHGQGATHDPAAR
jgi:hypothetical protein